MGWYGLYLGNLAFACHRKGEERKRYGFDGGDWR